MDARLLSAALLLLSALSGCAAKGQEAQPGPMVDAADSAAGGPAAGESPPSRPSSAPSPSSRPVPKAVATRPADPNPVVVSCKVDAVAGVGAGAAPVMAVLIKPTCDPGAAESRSGGPLRSAVVEMAWSNAAPTLVEASFAVFDGDGKLLAHVEGTDATLRLVLAGESFPQGPAVDLYGAFGGTGAFVQFEATLTFSYFEAAQPPDGYAAA
jgi:hypothetical protein